MLKSMLFCILISLPVLAAQTISTGELNPGRSVKDAQGKPLVPPPEVSLEQIAALPSVRAHRFVPLRIKSVGTLYSVYGYFDVPARLPSEANRKMYAEMYLTRDLDVAVYGQGYNVKTGAQYVNLDLDSVEKAVALTIGHGPRHYYLVSDPHCPFCTRLEKQLEAYADEATFHIILIALKMHKDAPNAVRCVLSKPMKDRGGALLQIADKKDPCGGKVLPAEPYALQMLQAEDAASILKVSGTPALFDAHGRPMEIAELERLKKPMIKSVITGK